MPEPGRPDARRQAAHLLVQGDRPVDQRLILALGFSAALHAAALTSLERLPAQQGERFDLRLTVALREAPSPSPAGPATASPAARAPAKARPAQRITTVPPIYYAPHELDVPAVTLHRPPLVYPEDPFMWKLRGTVRLNVFISEDGRVDRVEVVRADPPGLFEDAAVAAAMRLIYEPGMKGGRAVRSRKLIEVSFEPREAVDVPAPDAVTPASPGAG